MIAQIFIRFVHLLCPCRVCFHPWCLCGLLRSCGLWRGVCKWHWCGYCRRSNRGSSSSCCLLGGGCVDYCPCRWVVGWSVGAVLVISQFRCPFWPKFLLDLYLWPRALNCTAVRCCCHCQISECFCCFIGPLGGMVSGDGVGAMVAGSLTC